MRCVAPCSGPSACHRSLHGFVYGVADVVANFVLVVMRPIAEPAQQTPDSRVIALLGVLLSQSDEPDIGPLIGSFCLRLQRAVQC